MELMVHFAVLLLQPSGVSASRISSCPRISCNASEFATDKDDWCVRANIDEQDPSRSTVTIRECLGEEKVYCEWGMPGFIDKFYWPYASNVLGGTKLDLYTDRVPYEAKCLTAE